MDPGTVQVRGFVRLPNELSLSGVYSRRGIGHNQPMNEQPKPDGDSDEQDNGVPDDGGDDGDDD
jgi:hypothetical protein